MFADLKVADADEINSEDLQSLFQISGVSAMPTSATTRRLIEVSADVWTALRLKPGAPVRWEVRGDEAVMRVGKGGPKRRTTVADVAGMLAPKLKGRKVDWDAAAKSALANWGKLR